MVYATDLFTAADIRPTRDLRRLAHRDRTGWFDTPELEDCPSDRLTREQIVARILSLNPSATETFLGSFGDADLAGYLDHLMVTQRPRDGRSRWIRRHGPAVAVRAKCWRRGV